MMTKANHKLFHTRKANIRKRNTKRNRRIITITAIVTVLTTISLVAIARELKDNYRTDSAQITNISNNVVTLLTSDGNLWAWNGNYDIDVTDWNNSYTVIFDCNGTEDVTNDAIVSFKAN